MSTGFNIGPLAFSWGMLIVLIAAFSAFWVGERVARKTNVVLAGRLYVGLAVAFIAARVAFVMQYGEAYWLSPASMLDIRDGGWNNPAGFVALWLYAAAWSIKSSKLGKPLLGAAATVTLVWIICAGLISFMSPRAVPLPDFSSSLVDGAPVAISDFKGKPTVINLWATWCPPCVREMPVLERAQKNFPNVNVVFINQGESPEVIQRFLQAHSLDLDNVVMDPRSETGVMLKQRGMPSTLFFNKDGLLVDTRLGEVSQATLMQRLDLIRHNTATPAP